MDDYSLYEWIDIFLRHLQVERAMSHHTIASYGTDITQFAKFLEDRGIRRWSDVSREEGVAFFAQTRHTTAKRTQSRRLSSLRSFFSFLEREGAIARNHLKTLSFPKPDRTLPRALSVEDLQKLFSVVASPVTPSGAEISAKNSPPDNGLALALALRDTAILECLYGTGMRASEITALEMSNLRLEAGYVIVRGKGAKERIVPIGEYATDALSRYLHEGRPTLISRGLRSPLRGHQRDLQHRIFLNHHGAPLSRQGLWKIITDHAKRAGIAIHVTPRKLRHTFATHMLQGGADLKSLQMLLGHASISTTQIYTHIALRHLKEIHEIYHPRG